jgi:CHAT domain-containing protein/tetratricopeptide (TPR) repeat protein
LAVYERALGPDHPDVAVALNNLALLYDAQGRHAETEPLYKRALVIKEKALGTDHPKVALALNNLALLYHTQGRFAEAEPLYQRSLALREKALGPDHPDVTQSLINLASLYYHQGRYAEAEPLYKRALAISEKALGPDRTSGTILNNLASLYYHQGRYAEAEPLYKRTLAISERALGPDHPVVAVYLNNLAALALGQRDWAQAADYWRRAAQIIERRSERGLAGSDGGSAKGEVMRKSRYFSGHIKMTYRLASQGPDRARLGKEMFETAQWAQASDAASSLTQMAARSFKGDTALAGLVRERQDLVTEWEVKDKQLIAAKSQLPARRSPDVEKVLSDRLAAIDARLKVIDARFARDFLEYASLTRPKPASVTEVQTLLQPNEALVLFLDTPDFTQAPEETFIWVVTKTDTRWVQSELGSEALRREVAALRCGLDATSWWRDTACAGLTGTSYTEADYAGGKPLPFDLVRAHALYTGLLGDAEGLIKGKHLLFVPAGALTTLPFQVLVTKPPVSNDPASAAWLIRDHAITVLPSVGSLAALRRTAKPSAATKPMIGFGNPLLEGNQSHPRDGTYYKELADKARSQIGCAPTPEQRTASLRALSRSFTPTAQTAGIADLTQLKVQTPLPETADELCTVARSLGADTGEIRIGKRATETEIKRLSTSGDLAHYRILHFATHGVLAGQLQGTREPGLILTPPATATTEDDGYLSASEIAALKLDAEWVILSACNTAGGAGQSEAAESLSGLARMFFYAGARALLVSHWEVDSIATVKLITTAIGALAKDKSLGRAEALRRAMLFLIDDTSRPPNWVPASHPSVWAPFVVVGEGGGGR